MGSKMSSVLSSLSSSSLSCKVIAWSYSVEGYTSSDWHVLKTAGSAEKYCYLLKAVCVVLRYWIVFVCFCLGDYLFSFCHWAVWLSFLYLQCCNFLYHLSLLMMNAYMLVKVSAVWADHSTAANQHRQQELEQGSDCAGSIVQRDGASVAWSRREILSCTFVLRWRRFGVFCVEILRTNCTHGFTVILSF